MNWPIFISFLVYLLFMLAIGVRFWSTGQTSEGYLLGHRSLGSWITAFSAEASDMSGWLLLALPGTVYLHGPSEVWIAAGLLIGTYLNWRLVAARLRIYTEQTQTMTLPAFFAKRFGDNKGILQVISAILIVVFFTIYTSSGMVSTGKLIESVFSIPYQHAVILGGGVVIGYTFLGGYLAVCWTDMVQGLLMIIALAMIPILAFGKAGGMEGITTSMAAKGISLSIIPTGTAMPVVAIISSAAWGLGYFGQPHILARFMSIRSLQELRRSRMIAMTWVTIALTAATAIGLIAIGVLDKIPDGDHEKVTIFMITRLISRYLQGILLAAILAAIMSTIDSQLLVSASSLSEDIYRRFSRSRPTSGHLALVSRASVACISAIAIILAMPRDSLILRIVAYAWAGFGAAFGPVVLFALFSRHTTHLAASVGMVVGAATVVIWRHCGLSGLLYEILPGFAANCLAIALVNLWHRQVDPAILAQFDRTAAIVSGDGYLQTKPTAKEMQV